jgi:hypothetical protein
LNFPNKKTEEKKMKIIPENESEVQKEEKVFKVLNLQIKEEKVYFKIENNLLQRLEDISKKNRKRTKLLSIIGDQKTGKSFLLNNLFQNLDFKVGKNRVEKTTDGIDLSILEDEHQYQVILDCEGLQSQERKEWIESNMPSNNGSLSIERVLEHYNKSLALLLYRLSNILLLYCSSYNNGDLKLFTYIYSNKDLLGKLNRKPHLILIMQDKNLEEVEDEDDLNDDEIEDKRFEQFKKKKLEQIDKSFFSSISFMRIPTFKLIKGKFNQKKDEFDKMVVLLKEKIIYENCNCYYYGTFKDFNEIFIIGVNSINKNESLEIEKPKYIRLIEESDKKLFELLESCYQCTEDTINNLKSFFEQGRNVQKKIKECIEWIEKYFYAKTGTNITFSTISIGTGIGGFFFPPIWVIYNI